MRHTKFLLVLGLALLMALAIGACTSAPTPTPTAPRYATATPLQPTATPPTSLDRVRLALAKQLQVSPDEVQVHTSEQVDWPDGCLGVPLEDEACAEVITPGYLGIMIAGGAIYEFHSDLSGEQARFIPGAALTARQSLANQLQLDQEGLRFLRIERKTWPDSCLGLELADQPCKSGAVSGYLVLLQAGEHRYTYHTDETGSRVLLADAPPVAVRDAMLTWRQSTPAGCESAVIGLEQVAFGACDAAQIAAPLNGDERLQEAHYFYDKYRSFTAETPAGEVSFSGIGAITTTPSEQRMIAEWARLAKREAASGEGGASWSLAFTWQRQGGFAGLCQDVSVYLTGIAYVASCQTDPPRTIGKLWLTANQMRTLYAWVEALRNFEFEQSDPATADGMTTRLIFSGAGQEPAGEFEKSHLTNLAAELAQQASVTPDEQAIQEAARALSDYLAALSEENYAQAARLYGGDYTVLIDNNPSIPATDYPALFVAGCTLNGFVCDLQVRNFVHETQLSESEFRFTVELNTPQGELFLLGPCCGADPAEEPPWSQFDFLVKKVAGRYLVQDLPIYVP
ncbi:MAG: hypothetical protein PHD58_01170 [Anaerolineales bacterium]|nr:hypothetical protein [Anaerolineales bacterium]